uniref:Hexosyltransferase n=2 Tax=Steinernema glaseri TaxID=37863 RepID=A0A1I8ASI5_9BILA
MHKRIAVAVAVPFLLLCYFLGLSDFLFERSFQRDFAWPPYVDVRDYVVQRLLYNKSSTPQNSMYLFENDWTINRPLISPICNVSSIGPKNSLLIIVKTAPGRLKNRQAIRSTWGSAEFSRYDGFDIRTIFVMGSQPDVDLREEIRDYGDLLVGNFQDTYRNNTMKFILSIGYAYDHCNRSFPRVKRNVPYVLLIDDDYMLSIPNLVAEAKKFAPHERLYTGWRFDSSPFRLIFHKHRVSLSDYPFDRYPPYISAGAVLLTQQTVREFYHAIEHVRVYPYDDVYAGILAYLLGIYVRPNDRFQFWGSVIPRSEMGSLIGIHGYSPEQLAEMFSS